MSTIISLKLIPYFFALSQSVHDGLEEITYLYQQGKITAEEKQIFSSILNSGPIDTITLRNQLNFTISANTSRFNRALKSLQRDFRIVPSGISQSGRWKYSYIYQTVQNEFPDLVEQSQRIDKEDAVVKILHAFFRSNGTGTTKQIQRILGWHRYDIQMAINALKSTGEIIQTLSSEKKENDIYTIPELI